MAKTPKPTAKSINSNQEPKALEMLDVVWYKNHLYVAGGEPRSPWGHSYGKCLFQLLGGTPNCPLNMEKLPDFFRRFFGDRTCKDEKHTTLPKTNSSPLKMVVSNRNFLFQGGPHFQVLLLLVSGRVTRMS